MFALSVAMKSPMNPQEIRGEARKKHLKKKVLIQA